MLASVVLLARVSATPAAPPTPAATPAPDRIVTAEASGVRAQVTCSPERDSAVFCSARLLEVSREGKPPSRQTVGAAGSSYLLPENEGTKPLVIAELDGNGSPEVLLNLYSGGAHCCYSTVISYWVQEPPHEASLLHDWGDPGYRLEDLDQNGRPELVSRDAGFAYAFTSYAASRMPPQIWRFARGRLEDVTRDFPSYIEKDAAECWKAFQELSPKDPTGNDVRGLAAAYVADEYLLDRGSEGWRRLLAAYQKPDRKKFFAQLTALLNKNGYASQSD